MLRRRNLLKRVMPILLSLAMMLQSVPITAMAAELPVAATAEEAEAAESAEETEATVESAEETGAAEDVGAAESAAQPEEDAAVEDAAAEDGVKSDETTENTGDQPDAVTEEDGAKSDDAADDSESKPEAVKKPVAEAETEIPAVGADAQTGVAKIVVNDTAVNDKIGDFTRVLGEEGLVFYTEYVEDSKVGDLQDYVKYYWLDVEVDGEKVSTLKDNLTYTWKDEKGAQLVDAVPVNVGTYELTIALDIAGTNGLCTKVEPADGVKLTLRIEKAKIGLEFVAQTDPGKTVGELIDKINEEYTIEYKNRDYTVSRDIISAPDKKLPIKIWEIDENGARQEKLAEDKFDSTKDYILTIESESNLLTANANANYELDLKDSYKVVVSERQETKVKFERKLDEKGDLKDLIKVYDEKEVTIEEVIDGLFTEEPAVYVWDDKTEKDVILTVKGEDGNEIPVKPAAAWYTRIQLNEDPDYKVDEDAGEFKDGMDPEYVYKPMKEGQNPVDAGEYYIVWTYDGDEGAYEPSRSEAIRFTIDPAPVVINIDVNDDQKTEKGANLGFADGMTTGDVKKTLATIAYGVYPIVENAETGALEVGTTPIETTPEFFGTSYGIKEEPQMAQYYVPEFILQRRLVKMTEKGGNDISVDERTVDWEIVTGTLNVVVNKEDFGSIRDNEWPQDAEKDNLESVEFAFRVYFTGNKSVYDRNGYPNYIVPVTDVTTNAANRNYLADITKERLEASAVLLDIASAEDVTINTDEIVKAFVEDNPDSVYPETANPAEGEKVPVGAFANPAKKIYDQSGLFANRASYKKAEVFKLGENDAPGETTGIKNTDEKLTYTWNYITLDEYENYLKTWDEVQRQYKDFDDFYFRTWNEYLGWTDVEDGSLADPKSAGVYRLTVKFDGALDTDPKYRSAEAEVFFKVERQEVIVVPTAVQYVGEDDSIYGLSVSCNSLEVKKDYRIYKIPQNSAESAKQIKELAEKGDEASLEALKEYEEIPTDEALSSYATKNGTKYPANIVRYKDNIDYDNAWKVLRKEKDPVTGNDTDKWVEATGYYFEEGYTYGFVANWTGNLNGLDGEAWSEDGNYTTLDVKTYRETGEEKHHEAVGDVKFYNGKIYVEVDKDAIAALGKEYDGDAVSLEEAAKALAFYTDEELTASSKLPATVINTTDEYDPTKINIYWAKYDDDREGYIKYANKNAVYGGTYSLVLRFEGGPLSTGEETQDDTIYAPIDNNGWWYSYDADYEDAEFTITPRAITITPELLSAELLRAGDRANDLVTGNLISGKKESEGSETIVENVLPADEKFFTYAELAKGGFDAAWNGTNPDGVDLEAPAYSYDVSKDGGYPAFNGAASYVIQVDGREIQGQYAYLRYGKTYTVKLKNNLASPLAESYRVTYAPAEVKVEKRGNADVTMINSDLSAGRIEYNFNETADDGAGVYTVMPRGAVKFYYDNDAITVQDRYKEYKKLENTNVLGFRIYAPNEFRSDPDFNNADAYTEKIVYQNAIWNAGGYFYLNDNAKWKYYYGRYYIDVVFPLTKDTLDRSFNITWEDGYTETFKLADVVLEEDLTKAVAPKSMAFNGVATKMAVGERQQLNLKITKAQLGDVIAVRYRIKGSEETKNDYISLDPETGVVTGLKAGKTATQIEAYAVYKDAKGNFVPIEDSKGKQKVATTKITVTEVTASTIKKIVAQGNSAKVYYTVPDNGYRREFYVVDVTKGTGNEAAKKWKPAKFNEEIDKISHGDWETAGFAIAPRYSYAKNVDLSTKERYGLYDSKLKAHILTFDLKAEHEYVIYVRNVSAVRELDDGSVVTFSASGAVKKVKTIKSQVKGLDLDFTVKTDENDKQNTVTHPVRTDGTVDVNSWTVELSAKKAQLNVYGYFSDLNDAAEGNDFLKYPLVPTSKDKDIKTALKQYQLPKLEYAIFDDTTDTPFKPGEAQSKYAAINKKGLISLKGVDLNGETTVYIYVRDNMQHQEWWNQFTADESIALTITAKATSVTGKKVKAVVGQEIRLADCLTYKDGKKTLPNYRSGNIQITPEMKNAAKVAGYVIEDNPNGKWHDWYITAVAPNKDKFVLTVSDFGIEGNPTADITLTSKQMDPVKGLKVTYVDDKNITINFTHAANKNEADNGRAYEYAFEIKDARGNVVEKKILQYPDIVGNIDRANAKELKSVLSWIQKPDTTVSTTKLKDNAITASDAKAENQFNYYTGTSAKVKTFAYTYTNEKLVRLSSYTISVTPLYGNQKADKAATTKTKTTNIPASYKNPDLTGAAPDRRGGTVVEVTTADQNRQKNNDETKTAVVGWKKINDIDSSNLYQFTSGNIYTLKIDEDQNNKDVPRDRVTDTLTWKSSNTKVATIKANAGTYTATFKPVNQGETTITVTSKVTKKVIARWAVKVGAIRDGAGYGGDYEPTWDNGFYEKILALYDPYYDGPVEVLSMNVPLAINSGEDRWISFTAPHYGQYTFYESGDVDEPNDNDRHYEELNTTFYDSRDGKEIVGISNALFLEEGQKIYFQASGVVKVEGTEFARLTQANTKDNPLEVKAGCYAALTAWEDNVYTFWHNGTEVEVDGSKEIELKAGETCYIWVNSDGKIYVTWRELAVAALTTPVNVTLNKDNQARYVTYTAPEAGEYAFTYVVPADGVAVNYEIKVADGEEPKSGNVPFDGDEKEGKKETVKTHYLEKGQKVVIEFKAEPEITDAAKILSASVTVTGQDRRKNEWKDGETKDKKTIDIKKGTTEIVEYVIPAFTTEKAKFKFEVSGEEGTEIIRYLDKKLETVNYVYGKSFTLMAEKEKEAEFKAGDSIYIEITAGGDSKDENAKDAVLTVTQVSVAALTANTPKPETISNGTENWYTFTAPKDGFYEFAVDVADRAAGDDTPNHEVSFELYKKLFDENDSVGSSGKILDMKSGETLAIKLIPRYELAPKESGEAVTSTANVSVKELVATPLKLGKDKAEPVKITKASKEVKYYSFTAAVDAHYTIVWQPTDKEKVDNAKVTIFNGDLTGSSYSSTSWGNKLAVGGIKYVKVEVDDTSEEAADVDGSLCVTSDNLSATALTEGISAPYKFGGEGDPDVKVYRFTAPKAGSYAVETTVKNAPENEPAYDYPTISYEYYDDWEDDGYVDCPYETIWFEKGETKYFTLSPNGKTEGTILIRFLEEEVAGDQQKISVAYDVIKEYTFKITEAGRYEFKADYDKEKVAVKVKGKFSDSDLEKASGRYYAKNAEVTISVRGLDPDANATVEKLYKPAKITPIPLKVDEEKPIEVIKAEGPKYYEVNLPGPKTYEFNLTRDETSTAYYSIEYAYDNDDLSLYSWKNDITKDSKLFIKITSNDEETKLSGKLTIAEIKELKIGDNTVTLKAEDTSDLIFRAPEAGYYSFRVKKEGADLSFGGQTGDSIYDIRHLDAKERTIYSLSNNAATDIELTVKMAVESPIEVTPGSKTDTKVIPAGEVAYYALKTFKEADYLIKVADDSKGEDLTISGVGGTQATTADGITISSRLSDEAMLRIRNKGTKETSVTVELTVDEAQSLKADESTPITLKKGESKLISFVAAEDNRYLISKDNEKVTMTLVKRWWYTSDEYWTSTPNSSVSDYREEILKKAEKLVYKLSYTGDEKADAEQTVNVKIAPIVPTEIAAESTTITVDEKGNTSLWYQFTAKEDAVYTFSLEDEYENDVTDDGYMWFYSYMTGSSEEPTEKFMKTGEKLIINLKYLGKDSKYTLKYKAVKAITEKGTYTLDFEYIDEVQELKFVVPKAGTYKVSAAAFRGDFEVEGYVGNKKVMDLIESMPCNRRTELLNIGDVVTFKVKALKPNKSSISLRIAEDSVAAEENMTLGKEYTGVSSKENAIYYAIRIPETASYAISAGGAPKVRYYVNADSEKPVNDVAYASLKKDDRVIIEVVKANDEEDNLEAEYAVKIDSLASLDSNDAADKAFTANAGDTDYVFTKEKAFVKFTAPAAGNYYIAVQKYTGDMDASADNGWTSPQATLSLAQNAAVTFTFTNTSVTPESDDESSKNTTVIFRLTIRKTVNGDAINAGDTKTGTLAKNQNAIYQFKAATKATYLISFKGSGCSLQTDKSMSDNVLTLDANEILNLTVVGDADTTARYELSVTELTRKPLTLGETASETLKKGEKAYYEFASTVTSDTGKAAYQIYASGSGYGYCDKVSKDGTITRVNDYLMYYNREVELMKDEKLVFTLSCYDGADSNGGFKLTVKEVKYATIAAANTTVPGSLDANENAYYVFTSGNDKATNYKVSLTTDYSWYVGVKKLQTQAGDADPVDVDVTSSSVSLNKGEKLLITVGNGPYSSKKYSYELRVEELPTVEEPTGDQTETE